MPESVTTDSINVATVLAAAELTKASSTRDNSPETLAASFKTIFKAIVDARYKR